MLFPISERLQSIRTSLDRTPACDASVADRFTSPQLKEEKFDDEAFSDFAALCLTLLDGDWNRAHPSSTEASALDNPEVPAPSPSLSAPLSSVQPHRSTSLVPYPPQTPSPPQLRSPISSPIDAETMDYDYESKYNYLQLNLHYDNDDDDDVKMVNDDEHMID